MTDYTSQINQIYQAIQFQNGSASEVAQYNAGLISGALTLAQVTGYIEQESYTLNVVDPVIREYQAAFGRVPDQAGLKYWVGVVGANPSALSTLAVNFANSAEFNTRYAANATTPASVALVAELYANVLGRQPDAAGLAYWSNSGLDAAQLLYSFSISSEFIADTAPAITVYQNGEAAVPPSIPTTGSLLDLIPASPQTITLTTGVDTPTLTANGNTINGTFNGAGATLTPGDTLNGGTTIGNTLNLVDLGTSTTTAANLATSLSAVTISGIQTVNILSGEAVNANTASSPAGFTGLTQLNVTEANNGVGSTITAAATTNISVTDQSQAGGALSVQGGLNVTVATTEVATGSGSTIAVGGTFAAATTAPAGTVTITATAAPTTAGNFTMGAITVYGGTVVSITQTETAGSVNTTTTGGAVTVNGGASTTSVTVDQTAPVLVSTTVAGVTDGQVTITDANWSGGTKLGVITTVSLDGLNGANIINDSALANLTVNDSNAGTSVTINEGAYASPATTLALSLNNDAGLTLTDSGNKYTTVNVTLGAEASSLTLIDTALTTLKISGPSSGTAGALTFSSNATALTSINASGDNGNLTFTDSWAGAVFTGGAGNDIVTLAAALTTTAGGSITFGAGDNSLLTVPGFGSIGASVTVDGGSSGDNTISAALVNSGNAAGIKDFQILDVSGFSGSLDASLLSTPITGVAISSASTTATLLNLAAAVTVTDTHAADNSTLTLTHAGSATNSLAINFAGTSAANQEINSLTSTGDTTIAINSGGASTVNIIGNLLETDNHLTTITITGSQAFELLNVATDSGQATSEASSLTKIDGHLAIGGLTIDAGASLSSSDTYTGLIILGGAGGDTITNAAANGVITEGGTAATLVNTFNTLTVSGAGATINDQASASVDIINLSGANETANLGSGGTVTTSTTVNVSNATSAATFNDTVNFGSGIATVNDSLVFSATSNTTGNLLDLTGTLHGEILGFSAGIANTTSTLGTATTVTATNLSQAVSSAESHTANTVTWFQYGGNTYIENSGSTPTSTATAEVVQITGTVDLSGTTIAHGHLTFA